MGAAKKSTLDSAFGLITRHPKVPNGIECRVGTDISLVVQAPVYQLILNRNKVPHRSKLEYRDMVCELRYSETNRRIKLAYGGEVNVS